MSLNFRLHFCKCISLFLPCSCLTWIFQSLYFLFIIQTYFPQFLLSTRLGATALMRVRMSCFLGHELALCSWIKGSSLFRWPGTMWKNQLCVIHSTVLFLYSSRVLITHQRNNRETGKIIIHMRDGDITEYDSLHWLKWSYKTPGSLVSNQLLLFFDQSQRTSWWIMHEIMKLSVLTENEVRHSCSESSEVGVKHYHVVIMAVLIILWCGIAYIENSARFSCELTKIPPTVLCSGGTKHSFYKLCVYSRHEGQWCNHLFKPVISHKLLTCKQSLCGMPYFSLEIFLMHIIIRQAPTFNISVLVDNDISECL